MADQTLAEKLLEDASDAEDVTAGDHIDCSIDKVYTHDHSTHSVHQLLDEYGIDEVFDPDKIFCVMDHEAPPVGEDRGEQKANEDNLSREFAKEHGITQFYDYGNGISHNVLPERGHVKPGELIVGGDSHTTTACAVGAAGTGMGTKDVAYIFATGKNWFRVPESVKIEVKGEFANNVTEKDLVLYIAEKYGNDVGRYRSIEYTGEAIENMPMDRRFTLSNLGIELGAKFAFTPIDDVLFDYVDERTDGAYDAKQPDPDAVYEEEYTIRADEITPKISEPPNIGDVVDIDAVEGKDVDVVFIGSCTNGKFQDLADAAKLLEGNTIHKDTRMIITPATSGVSRRLAEDDLLQIFIDAGATITHPTCGACAGVGPGSLGDGEVCVAAQNRNGWGRMGSETSEIYLSSPTTAAATAIQGHIADPREV